MKKAMLTVALLAAAESMAAVEGICGGTRYTVSDGVVWRDNESAGRSGHMGHALVNCGNGRILDFTSNCAGMERVSGHSGYGWMEYRTSDDYGRTFGPVRVLPCSRKMYDEGRHTALCEKAVRAPDGRIVLFFQITDASRPISCEPWSEPLMAVSDDGGETFSDFLPTGADAGRIYDAVCDDKYVYFIMQSNPNFPGSSPEHVYKVYRAGADLKFEAHTLPIDPVGRGYGALEFAADGTLHAYAYNSRCETEMDVTTSRDRGETWSAPRTSRVALKIRNPQVRRLGGVWFLIGRNGGFGKGDALAFYTSTDGVNWDEGVKLDVRPDGTGTGYYGCMLPIFEPGQPPRMLMQYSRPYKRSCVNVVHRTITLADVRPRDGAAAFGALCLSFDDRNFDAWERCIPLFEEYGAHATFFVCGPIDARAEACMKRLSAAGHSVGLHGLRHQRVPQLVKKLGEEGYLREEILPQLSVCRERGIPVRSFAYPMSARTAETDALLLRHFDRLRTGAAREGMTFPTAEAPSRRLLVGMPAGSPDDTPDKIVAMLPSIAAERKTLVTYAHNIEKPGTRHDRHNVGETDLRRILVAANAAGVAVIGMDELPGSAAAQPADYAPPTDYGVRSKSWRLDGSAERLLAEWGKMPYTRKAGRTDFFVRAQLKYGIDRSDFIHHWYDRPLLQDSSLKSFDELVPGSSWLNEKGWEKTVSMARMGKQTGFAVFTCTKSRDEVIPLSVKPGSETTILVELTRNLPLEDCVFRAKQALDMPNSYRIGGKVVLTSYPSIKEKDLPFYAELKKTLTSRYGDKFLVMPYCTLELESRAATANGYTADVLLKMRARLERFLRVLDGLCYNGRESFFNRRYDPWLFDTVFVPMVHATFAAPEFRDKCLGCWATPGHENTYRWNYGLDCTGTRMLRDMLASVVKLGPDFMIGCEWDEENENTCFRPMVAHGFTHQRLLRYFHDVANGLRPDALPGDDSSVPNLVLSYRKELMAGEPLEAEVLNIPDGTFDGKDVAVSFAWKGADGRVVREFAPQKLKGGELSAAWFKAPVSSLVEHMSLVPELTVFAGGVRKVYSAGFWPVGLRPSRCIEYKWAKHPIRDLPKDVAGGLCIGSPDENGVVEVRGEVRSSRRLRSVAVLDETDTVYMYDGRATRDADSVRVRIAFQGYPFVGKKPDLKGRISLSGAPGAKLSIVKSRGHIAVDGADFVFTGAMANNWPHYLMAEIPAAEAQDAKFKVDVDGYFEGSVAVGDLLKKEVVGIPGKKGANLVFTRYLSQMGIPPPQFASKANFSFRLKPGMKRSVLRMETVDEDYRVWRSSPVVCGEAAGRAKRLDVFERDEYRVSEIAVDESRAPVLDYSFEPSRGSVVTCSAGRNFWGVLGGCVPLVTGFGQGESGYGDSAHFAISAATPGWEKSAPDYVREPDGSWSLRFSGCSHVSLPQQIWPVQCGFALEVEVNPDTVDGKRTVVSSGGTSSSLYIKDGKAYAHFFLRNRFMLESGRAASVTVEGPRVEAGRWQTLRVVCDQRKAWVEVDGVRGAETPVSGDLFYPLYTAVGAEKGSGFFSGRMKRLKIEPL